MDVNVLSYTSLDPNPCNEGLHLSEGQPCMSKSILKKLYKLEEELNKDNPNPIPIVPDEELLPTDGSKDAHMIRRLAFALNCDSEYAILTQDVVKKVLTDSEIKKEKTRFKVVGPRLSNVGTEGEKHAYRTLLKWAEVFTFFFPLSNAIYTSNYTKNTLNSNNIMEIISNNYPDIRLLASDISILIENKNLTCGHAIVILIDLRGDDFEEWTIEYFDASGSPPPNVIIPFMEDMKKKLQEFRKNEKHSGPVHIIPVTGMLRHQTTTTECGMHSLIYIRRRLEGISYRMFSKHKIPDSFARSFRRDIFVL
tara:strand:- start:834 stop:1760 length:927 start_codon:yes stop_codon:yes gene_type:complete